MTPKNVKIPTTELVHDVIAVAKKLRKMTVSESEYHIYGKYGTSTVLRRFGGWSMALNACGLYSFKEHRQIYHRAERKPVSLKIRHLVLKRDEFRCVHCGASPGTCASVILHVDHIVPVAKGGTYIMENLQTLCSRCNIGKSDIL